MNGLLTLIQKFVAADKAAVTTAVISGLALLCVHFGMKLNGSDMTYLGIAVSFVIGAFLHAHFAVAKAAAKPPAEPKS